MLCLEPPSAAAADGGDGGGVMWSPFVVNIRGGLFSLPMGLFLCSSPALVSSKEKKNEKKNLTYGVGAISPLQSRICLSFDVAGPVDVDVVSSKE